MTGVQPNLYDDLTIAERNAFIGLAPKYRGW